jgi:hypothetical protein
MSQHDYVIANGTGAAVRSDLNNALAAIVSNNSGASEPTTTYAYMWWPDTTSGNLKLRNGANNAWITLRQLDGDFTTVSVDNGTNSAPSIYFNASGTDTGIYSSGTDAVDFTTAGTRRFGIASGGDITVYGGNVTLNAQGDLRFADSDSSNWVAFQSPATVASNVTWTLPSADGTTGQVLSTNGSGTLSWATPTPTIDKISEGNTEAEVVDTGADGHFKVTTEGTERLRVDPSGRLLVGTSTAAQTAGTTSAVQIFRNNLSELLNLHLGFNGAAAGARINLSRSRNTTHGSYTILQNGDEIGGINFIGDDGVDYDSFAAKIYAEVDGTPGANDMPGRLVFSTTADGASSPTERMRIGADGLAYFASLVGSGVRNVNAGSAGNLTTSASDERLKENIETLDATAGKIKALNPVKYQWKDREMGGDSFYLGFIAQQLETVFPECVYENSDGMKGINYTDLIAPLTKALQEALTEIDVLKSKVAALEAQ